MQRSIQPAIRAIWRGRRYELLCLAIALCRVAE